MEAASRARKEALIEPLAQFLHHYSERMTAELWGSAVQISYGQAARKAAECIEVNYVGFKYRMVALGYVYSESARRWQPPPAKQAVPSTVHLRRFPTRSGIPAAPRSARSSR